MTSEVWMEDSKLRLEAFCGLEGVELGKLNSERVVLRWSECSCDSRVVVVFLRAVSHT